MYLMAAILRTLIQRTILGDFTVSHTIQAFNKPMEKGI